jgi:arabinofuranosyltransferase
MPESSEHVRETTLERGYRTVWRWTLVLMALQAIYAVAYILHSAPVVEGTRYFCLFDDAMISMRYAANLVAGHGLVWNPGERVEGYTNLLWTLILAAFHLPRLSPSMTCLVVQLLGVVTLWAILAATFRLARACRLLPAAAFVALALLAAYHNLIFFTLMGMETGLLTALLTLAAADVVRDLRRGTASMRPFLWLAAAMLTRPDSVLAVAVSAAFVACGCRAGRGRAALGLAMVVAVVVVHALWRVSYYGEWLPNTYYLKATGWPLAERLPTGLRMTAFTALSLGLPGMLALASLARRGAWKLYLLALFVAHVAYQVYVGGDAWPWDRFVIGVTPGLFVLAACGIVELLRMTGLPKAQVSGRILHASVALLMLVLLNIHRADEFLLLRSGTATIENRISLRQWRLLERIAAPDATALVGYAGALPYYSGRVCIDMLGKCEPHIARQPASPHFARAGHNKSDYRYALEKYKPDVAFSVFSQTPEFALYPPYAMDVDGQRMLILVRTGTAKVRTEAPLEPDEAGRLFIEIYQHAFR